MLEIKKGTTAFEEGLVAYWALYRNLQEQLLNMSFDIDFSEGNFSVYSAKFLMLLETVCGEVEAVAKTLVALTHYSEFLDIDQLHFGDCWYYIQDKYKFHYEWNFKKDIDGEEHLSGGKSLQKASVLFLGKIPIRPFAHFVMDSTGANENQKYFLAPNAQFPSWWHAHNILKHRRIYVTDNNKIESNFTQANFYNTICAFAALYILTRCLLENLGDTDDLKSFVDTDKLFRGRSLRLDIL